MLLKRMRGTAPASGGESPTRRVAPVGFRARALKPVVINKSARSLAERQADTAEQRRRALQSLTDLPAMRELANQSARAALDLHARKQCLNDIYLKATV